MITVDEVKKKAAQLKAQELKDLDVDRVDGVDKPATGRNFLLFKRAAKAARELDGTIYLTAEDMVEKGVPGPASREYPLEDQPTRTGPRVADEGEDALGREYSDAVYGRLGGMNGVVEDATTAPRYAAEGFSRDRGGRLVRPLPPYENAELGEAGSAPVRLGDGWVMNPRASGIAEPLDFEAPSPAAVVKRERRRGLFKSAVLGPMAGASRTSNFFDAPSVRKSEKKLGEGLFSDVVGEE